MLPVGISFYTFQQIAYLVDSYRNEAPRPDPVNYLFVVVFFPHLIAGPLVRQSEIVPQISDPSRATTSSDAAAGLILLSIGLAKKVLVADNLAPFATPFFSAAAQGVILTTAEAWLAALAFTFQLYFDFSGYSDMALGLARLFGVRFPVNFASPYKATSLIDFWRRWHITLSRFLRDYLYVPLGGNRCGGTRHVVNIVVVMTLGGLWHGAAWTFVAWGLFHGVLLTINHLWRRVQGIRANSAVLPWRYRLAGGLLTFVAVVFGWVLFRATSLESAVSIWTSMLGGYGISLPRVLDGVDWLALSMVRFEGMFHNGIIGDPIEALPWLVLAALLVWCAPNAQELLRLRDEALSQIGVGRTLSRIPDWGWSIVVIATFIIATMNIAQVSEFLYFQF